jgi:predicted GNAT superfamily acetyltransferase
MARTVDVSIPLGPEALAQARVDAAARVAADLEAETGMRVVTCDVVVNAKTGVAEVVHPMLGVVAVVDAKATDEEIAAAVAEPVQAVKR